MTTRRSFFKRLASLVAVVALAPEIAFARKLETDPALNPDTLNLNELFDAFYSLKQMRHDSEIDILTDRVTAEKIRNAMVNYYHDIQPRQR